MIAYDGVWCCLGACGAGADPPLPRAHVYYLGSISPGVRLGDIHKACADAGLGKVRTCERANTYFE